LGLDCIGDCDYLCSNEKKKEVKPKHLLAHRRLVYYEAMQVLIDKVVGKRSDYKLKETLKFVKDREKKLIDTKKKGRK
jgi:hypothetical protein